MGKRIASRTIGLSASLALLLSSCAQSPGGGFLSSHSADPNDVCGAAHAELFNSRGYFERSIVEGAVVGAAGGAALGAILGAATGGSVGKSALIGAGAGMVAGGLTSYYQARQQQAKDNAELAGMVDGDISKESAEVSRATVALNKVTDCRRQAAQRIKADYKAGRINRETATAQLATQRRLFESELAEAESIGAKMDERRQQMNLAADKVLGEDPSAKAAFQAQQQQAAAQPHHHHKKKTEQAQAEEASATAATPATPPEMKNNKAYAAAVENDNLNKRSGDYAAAVGNGKQLVAQGGFDLAGG